VLGITDGFADVAELTTNTDLTEAIDATSAAATVVLDNEGKMTIYLFADAMVYTFSQKSAGPTTLSDNVVITTTTKKVLRNGQVFIIRDGKTYNMMGQEVR
jgi:hypothetical protein